eukprot:TRINITY_DN27288_c0_g1_i1.p1 TRINITY_DN27288_c0_g1~~TRINITY_DN27288_c0_g1_i1.p1  ORF type:complete len:347 (+),score=54.06 TRINITY_DN27288_c0_g1_i1:49-1089(+)
MTVGCRSIVLLVLASFFAAGERPSASLQGSLSHDLAPALTNAHTMGALRRGWEMMLPPNLAKMVGLLGKQVICSESYAGIFLHDLEEYEKKGLPKPSMTTLFWDLATLPSPHPMLYNPVPLPHKRPWPFNANQLGSWGATVNSELSDPERGLFVVDGFLTPFEAESAIKRYQHEKFTESRMVNADVFIQKAENTSVAEASTCAARRSLKVAIPVPKKRGQALQLVQARAIEAIKGASAAHLENTQVTHYNPGGFYSAHLDEWDPKRKDTRIATVLVYLSGHSSSGATYFPFLRKRVTPEPGRAAIFFPLVQDAQGGMHMNQWLRHMSEDTNEDKYVVQQWVKMNPG